MRGSGQRTHLAMVTSQEKFTWGKTSPRDLTLIIYVMIMVFVANSGCVGSTSTGPNSKEEVCSSIDIRNSVSQFKKLENCTVIEGFLRVLLIDRAESWEYANLSFPKLREITGYFLLFRVKGLQSLRTIFPNLSVIRGSEVFHNYAFVIYELFELQEIGLPSLTDIMRGAVRIEKNPKLCYVDSIDWSYIAKAAPKDANFIVDNNKKDECPNTCPQNCPLSENKVELCWSNYDCQKKCSPSCGNNACLNDKSECCHEYCVGGCWNTTQAACFVCRNYSFDQRCTDQVCPANTFLYFGRRCLNADECKSMSRIDPILKTKIMYKPFNGKCESECPSGYKPDVRNETCELCGKEGCPKECDKGHITSIAEAQELKGCTVILNNLEIQISGGQNIVSELQKNLHMIEEIRGYLKVVRSFPLMSLNFLENLRTIGGKNANNQAENYALFVVDNQNLQELWTWNTRKFGLNIKNGKIFFHSNPKLCINKIRDLEKMAKLNESDGRDVSLTSNGDRIACQVTKLNVRIDAQNIGQRGCIIHFTNFLEQVKNNFDQRALLGYLISYKEVPEGNVSIFDDADSCATETWKVKDVNTINKNITGHEISELITPLKPFTRYALYVKTYTIASEKQGGQSDVVYFKTNPDVPSPPVDLTVDALSHDRLKISWKPPKQPNGEITSYVIIGELEDYNQKFIYSRDYCGDFTDHRKHYEESLPTEEPPKKSVDVQPLGKNCCECPKGKIDEEIDEQEHQARIDFENFLHNIVYQKRVDSDADLNSDNMNSQTLFDYNTLPTLRRKREVTNEANKYSISANSVTPGGQHVTKDMDKGFITTLSAFDEQLTNVTASKNGIRGNEGNYSFRYTVNKTEVEVDLLEHFAKYTIKVIACHGEFKNNYINLTDNNNCSHEAIVMGKTKEAPHADDINATLINVTVLAKSIDAVFVKWEAPTTPNGLVLNFEVENKRVEGNHNPTITCVTFKKYLNGSGIGLTSLSAGNYSLRLRALSLAGYGVWTEPRYFYIPDPPSNITPAIIGGIVSAVVIVIVIIIASAWIIVKKRERQPPDVVHYTSVNPEYLPAEDVYIADEWEVPREKIKLLRELGQGSFGMVYEGEAKDLVKDKPIVRCAVKTVNETATMRERIDFLNEASVMKAFECHHVVSLLGVVSKGHPTYVVMELMFHGDLKTYLRLHRPDEYPGKSPPSVKRVLQMAIEIADGMAYLADKKYVHRDLAARNCMVAEDLTVKIGDFGMTRDIYETDYYRKGGKGLLPVRWMAPESLKDGVFTSQSDVWSFGVVMWEMATLASQPYQGLSNEQVLKYVIDGGIMEKPENCLDKLHELMRDCWHYNPKSRPMFLQLIERLIPDAQASFSELSFYRTFQNRESSAREVVDIELTEEEERGDDDDDDVTPSTPLRSPNDGNVTLRINHVPCEDDEVEGGGRQATYVRHPRPPQQNRRQQSGSSGNNEGSKGMSISSSDGSKDSKGSTCSANGSVVNGRIGMHWPSEMGC